MEKDQMTRTPVGRSDHGPALSERGTQRIEAHCARFREELHREAQMRALRRSGEAIEGADVDAAAADVKPEGRLMAVVRFVLRILWLIKRP